jgi:hypothetical protein
VLGAAAGISKSSTSRMDAGTLGGSWHGVKKKKPGTKARLGWVGSRALKRHLDQRGAKYTDL